MVTTAQLRSSYPELVTNRSIPTCDYSRAVPVVFLAGGTAYPGGRVTLRVHPAARQAFRALAAVLHFHGYRFRETSGGTLSCRKITGGTDTSPHAHGVAADFNPSLNGYKIVAGQLDDPDTAHAEGVLQWGRYTDMPPAMVRDVEAIRTVGGLKLFEWGGRWWNIKDPMHYELDVLQSSLTAGVNLATVKGWGSYLAFEGGATPTPTPTPTEDPMLKRGDKGPTVAKLQRGLKAWNAGALPTFGADGDYGAETEEWVAKYQAAAGVPRVLAGTADALTTAFILSNLQPEGGGSTPDLSGLATKTDLANHAAARPSATLHPHRHDEGETGGPIT